MTPGAFGGTDGSNPVPSSSESALTGTLRPLQTKCPGFCRTCREDGTLRPHAFSLMGPMVMAMLFREVFAGVGANPPDLEALADQHARTALRGLLMPKTSAS